MKILVSTIVRQRIKTLPVWYDQIVKLVELNNDIEFHLSVAENCSADGSREFLQKMDTAAFAGFKLLCEDLGTRYYSSGAGKDEERCRLLAEQRNKTLDQVDLNIFDKIAFIEPDIRYDPAALSSLLRSEADIISPRTWQGKCEHYDTWSCRRTSRDLEWKGAVPKHEMQVYATWSQFCVAKAAPVALGFRFSHINPRLNRPDNDVTSLAEHFHSVGLHNIVLKGDLTVEHLNH